MIYSIIKFIIQYRAIILPALAILVFISAILFYGKNQYNKGITDCKAQYLAEQAKHKEAAQKKITEVRKEYEEIYREIPRSDMSVGPATSYVFDRLSERSNGK